MDFLTDILDVIISGIKWVAKEIGLALIALKTLLISIFIMITSMFLKTVSSICIDFTEGQMNDLGVPVNMKINFTGLAGYIISTTQIDDCLYVILGAILTRFIISFIPFKS